MRAREKIKKEFTISITFLSKEENNSENLKSHLLQVTFSRDINTLPISRLPKTFDLKLFPDVLTNFLLQGG